MSSKQQKTTSTTPSSFVSGPRNFVPHPISQPPPITARAKSLGERTSPKNISPSISSIGGGGERQPSPLLPPPKTPPSPTPQQQQQQPPKPSSLAIHSTLPPSPPPSSPPSTSRLGGGGAAAAAKSFESDVLPRLRSTSKYTLFAPNVLATRTVPPLYSNSLEETNVIQKWKPKQSNTISGVGGGGGTTTTMAALAGPYGISIFHTHRPYSPDVILQHYTSFNSFSSLAFQPPSGGNGSILLAAARGTGVLLYDITCMNSSPLIGRLGQSYNVKERKEDGKHIACVDDVDKYTINDLSWKSSTLPILLTSSCNEVSLWDLRAWTSSSSGGSSLQNRMRPSSRYPYSGNNGGGFISVATSLSDDNHVIGTMDQNGLIQVYDDRMGGGSRRKKKGGGCLEQFVAFNSLGLGLSSLPPEEENEGGQQRWLTWGFDSVQVGDDKKEDKGEEKEIEGKRKNMGSVKVFTESHTNTTDSDSYWYMDNSSSQLRPSQLKDEQHDFDPSESGGTGGVYKLTAQFGTSSKLNCARICPLPFYDSGRKKSSKKEEDGERKIGVVTVCTVDPQDQSIPSGKGEFEADLGWKADLWILSSSSDSKSSQKDENNEEEEQTNKDAVASSTKTFGAQCATTLYGGGSNDMALKSMVGIDYTKGVGGGRLIAAELAVGSDPTASLSNITATAEEEDYGDVRRRRQQQQQQRRGGGVGKSKDEKDEEEDDDDEADEDSELLLCCLGSKGYLTTHAIPEAASLIRSRRRMRRSNNLSPTRLGQHRHHKAHLVRPSQSVVAPARIYLHHSQSDPISFQDEAAASAAVAAANNKQGGGGGSTTNDPIHLNMGGGGRSMEGEGREGMTTERERIFSTGGGRDTRSSPFHETTGEYMQSLSPPNINHHGIPHLSDNVMDPLTNLSRGVDGGLMQFDMDVSGGGGGVVAGPFADAVVGAAGVVGVAEEEGSPIIRSTKTDEDIAKVDPFKAMDVPCPRPCGATFGCGDGGIIAFHNGGVCKMWNWFQSDLQRRPGPAARTGGLARMIPQPPLHGSDMGIAAMRGSVAPLPQQNSMPLHTNVRGATGGSNSGADGPSGGEGEDSAREISYQRTPRTMLDLMRMNAAAKIAQWGEENDGNAVGATTASDDESETEDSSDDDSISDTDSDDDEEEYTSQLYENVHKRSPSHDTLELLGDVTTSGNLPQKGRKLSNRKARGGLHDPFGAGPSVDPLSPVVFFTRRYDEIVMSGQSPKLAEGWQLGAWWHTSGEISSNPVVPNETKSDEKVETERDGEEIDGEEWGWVDEPGHAGSGNTESCRIALPNVRRVDSRISEGDHSFNSSPLPRNNSSASLDRDTSKKHVSNSERIGGRSDGEGQLNNKRETMIGSLKKLFHQQHQGSVMITPPDQNILHKTASNSDVRRINSSGAILQHSLKKQTKEVVNQEDFARQNIGVRIISTRKHLVVDSFQKQLSRTKKICQHNASVCYEINQKNKGDVWSLLAQVVDNISLSEQDSFDGWGVPKYSAFGQELVRNLLRYYEAQGDIQMLASVVCVLSGGMDRRKRRDDYVLSKSNGDDYSRPPDFYSLLPDDDDRYDAYLYRYSALLYSWGQLTVRTEISKHFAHSVPGAGGEQLIPVEQLPSKMRKGSSFIPNEGVAAGITFAPLCPRCHKPVSETNVCETCKDYAFRCSICTNAVRGLFTVCLTCGHGGHVEHILPWFSKNTTCPSGCGCSCILSTHGSLQQKFPLDNRQAYISKTENTQRSVFGPTASTSHRAQESSLTRSEMLSAAAGSIPFGAYQPTLTGNASSDTQRRPIYYGDEQGQRRAYIRRSSVS